MKNIILILGIFLLFAGNIWARHDIDFLHLGLDEGLSQISVNTIYQDEYEQIWIGTRDGLNLFDGNKIKVFYSEKSDSTGLLYSHIRKICGDKNGSVFIKNSDALSVYDIRKEQFRLMIPKDVLAINYSNKHLLVVTRQEVLKYLPEKSSYDTLHVFEKSLPVSSIWEDSQQNVWLSTDKGIFILDKGKTLKSIVPEVKATNIFEDSKQNIWIGTWENGVYIFNTNLQMTNLREGFLGSGFVRDVCEDNNGNYWIGTFKGLDLYDPVKKTVTSYNEGKETGELSHSSVWCIMKDSQGSIWLGTYFGGINYFNPEYTFYHYYLSNPADKMTLSSPIVGKMTEDKIHNLWICTEGGGLNFFNRNTQTFKSYRHDPKNSNSISHDNLKSISYDEEKELLWIGTHTGGLNRFDIRTETFRTYRKDPKDPYSLPDDVVKDIIPYKDQLILATYNGVCMFNPETGKCENMFPKDKFGYDNIETVVSLYLDSDNRLWFSVYGEGIFCYNFKTNQLKNYRYYAHNLNTINGFAVSNIFQDHKFRLWFGSSEDGLSLYRPETDDFITFTTQNSGLLSNNIAEIQESRYGYLLVATGHGFSRFDVDRDRFYNYNRKNGFPLSAINDGAAYITTDGEIFLGGVTGLVSFYEKELNKQHKSYLINLERLMVNNQDVKPGDGSNILSESILMTDKIRLNNKHSVFSIDFSTSNYISSNKRDLEYRLLGFNESWIDVESRSEITYTNLDPGSYLLEIREKNPDSSGDVISRSLLIEVAPPFYKTWEAYLIYFTLLCLLVWWLLNYYRTRTLLVLEKKEKMQIEELNQKKLRFFTNISHEFRTPVSLIMGQTEMLLEFPNLQPAVFNKALSIYRNSKKMDGLITELIDFRKQEQGYMKLKVCKQDIVSFLKEIYLSFKENAEYKKLEFNFSSSCESAFLWFDSNQLQKVFNNLLSNAFKYTRIDGKIEIVISCQSENVEVRIEDSGIGISKEALDKVFDRFYQEDNPESPVQTGSGIGLALAKGIVELHKGAIRVVSEPGTGSTFIVTLPLNYPYKDGEVTVEENHGFSGEFTTEPFEPHEISELMSEVPEALKNDAPRIFIAEDNDDLREMLVQIFESLYQVQAVPDGENAFEKIQEWQPDIVLSDVMMPKVSGTELCMQIKSHFDTCHIPVVLLTAQTSVEHNIRGLQTGADDYITKPFNIRMLITRCNNLVNGRKVLQEKFSKHPVFSAQLVATNSLDKDMIEKAQAIVEKYLDDSEFDVNVFAQEMALGRTKLFAKIKGVTGQTPNEFIQTIRLKKGAQWLKNAPEMSVADITYSLGFSSPRYFSKCFKEAFGVSPAFFRKGTDADELEDEMNS